MSEIEDIIPTTSVGRKCGTYDIRNWQLEIKAKQEVCVLQGLPYSRYL